MPDDSIDPPEPPEPADHDKTFGQDDVNRLLADQRRKLLADQPDLTDLRTKAKAFDDLQAQSLSDLEKERAARVEAEKTRDDAIAKTNGQLIDAAVRVAASKAGTIDADAVARLIDRSGLTLTDTGDVEGVDEIVKTFLEDKPHFASIATPPKPEPGGGDGGPMGAPVTGQLSRADIETMKPQDIEAARQSGRLNDILGIT